MWKRVALLAAIAALAIWNPAGVVAQEWAGWDGGGWDGGRFDRGGCCISVTVRVHVRPRCCRPPIPPRPIACCERPFIPPRPIVCCERPFIPQPVVCCDRFPRTFARPPYFYGDHFAPYVYNWNRYDGADGYDGYYN
jgi:hypothetical protein